MIKLTKRWRRTEGGAEHVALNCHSESKIVAKSRNGRNMLAPPVLFWIFVSMAVVRTVLLADDDEALAMLLERAIHRNGDGISLKCVADGDEAIEYLSRKGQYSDDDKYPFPSLLLLDLKMPKVTGFEVLEWKRTQQHLRSLPVVIWSSSGLDADKERAERLGAVSYFVKPMETGGFAELVEYLKCYHAEGLSELSPQRRI